MTATGRDEPVASEGTGRSRGLFARRKNLCQVSAALQTLTATPAAELKVGLKAITVSSPGDFDRLLTLPCSCKPCSRSAWAANAEILLSRCLTR